MATSQRFFAFMAIVKPPENACHRVLRQVDSEAQAVAVSMHGHKLAGYAAQLGISVPYLSRIASGQRDVPAWFVEPFCYATGTNLLKQYRALQEHLSGTQDVIRNLALQLRRAA